MIEFLCLIKIVLLYIYILFKISGFSNQNFQIQVFFRILSFGVILFTSTKISKNENMPQNLSKILSYVIN